MALGNRFIARQPILDGRHRIFGHELVVRDGDAPGRSANDAHDAEAARALAELFSRVGVDALLGSTSGFVRVTPELLHSELVEALPADRVVLEIPPLAQVGRALEARCRELRREGQRLALRGFERRDARESLLPFARYAKVDLALVRPPNLRPLVRRLKRADVLVVAEHVGSPAAFQEAREAGCDYFQGFYFTRPAATMRERIAPESCVLTELLMKLSQDCDFDEIVETFKKNAALGVGLLRLVNSGSLARATRIKTVPEALVLIGRDHLARWLTVLLYSGDDGTGMEDAQLKVSARRGRSVELLYKIAAPGGEDPGPDTAYLVGMLSLVDVLFGVPMKRVLDEVAVDDTVRDALLHRRGLIGQLLRLEETFETLAFDQVDALLAELGIPQEAFAQAHHEAHAWVHGNESPRFEVVE